MTPQRPIPLGYAETVHEQALVDASYPKPVEGGAMQAAPLPEPLVKIRAGTWTLLNDCNAYTAAQMQEYGDARAALALQSTPVAQVEASVAHLRRISVRVIPGAPMPAVGSLLYAAPTAAQGLSDAEIALVAAQIKPLPMELALVPAEQVLAFARAILSANRSAQETK